LQDVVRQRVRDGVLTRLIGKWLKAGVMEDGQWRSADAGTPQGGIVSPALANVFLHEVLDRWFEETVKPRMRGRAHLVRYADDAVLLFEREDDARRVLRVIYDRFAKYGLTVHPDKTQLIAFTRPSRRAHRPTQDGQTFDLLGFTHYWGRSRHGAWVIKRKTAKDRLRRSLRSVDTWCRDHRHWPVAAQWAALSRKLEGHYRYYGVPGNIQGLRCVWSATQRSWRYWLARRSQHGRMPWARFRGLLTRYPLPPPRLLASRRV
jgi:hypothetical protein